eukprot:GHVN01104204.1.p1 GENE.GHVN01104204.1~~GHVN01104204.1.p1  ORF type:complete len:188 (+),score=22.41 GHVN01104204.1:3673-4236(+)
MRGVKFEVSVGINKATTTLHPVMGCFCKFKLNGDELLIVELTDTSMEPPSAHQLLPHDVEWLQSHPSRFISQHSHWICMMGSEDGFRHIVILSRPISYLRREIELLWTCPVLVGAVEGESRPLRVPSSVCEKNRMKRCQLGDSDDIISEVVTQVAKQNVRKPTHSIRTPNTHSHTARALPQSHPNTK